MKPRIVLIYPGLVEGFGSYHKGSDWFNHGLGFISSLLKSRGYDVAYLDCRKLSGWDEVASAIHSIQFDLALISVATVDFDASRKIAAIIKTKKADAKVMVGGPHPTLMTEETAEVKEFDHIFTHEAERTLPGVLDSYPDLPRLIRGEIPADLNQLPFVDRALAPEGETPWFKGLERPFFTVIASRGCLYRCSFCQPAERTVFGNKVRKRSVGNILDELELLGKAYGMRSFMLHDDCFTQYIDWVEEFCREKKRRGIDQPFVCQSRADIISKNPDVVRKLADAGLQWVLIGFESGSNRILDYIKKGTTVEQNIMAADICRQLKVKVFANYMFGLPGETKVEMKQTADMIRRIRPDMYSPSVFTPAPGSELYEYCREQSLIIISSAEGYRRSVFSGPKIKGVDYSFVNKMIYRSLYGKYTGTIRMHAHSIRNSLQRQW